MNNRCLKLTISAMAELAACYSRCRVRRVVKRKASNKSCRNPIISPTVARKLKALEEGVEFHYSVVKDALDLLNAELANITQPLRNESKCYASA